MGSNQNFFNPTAATAAQQQAILGSAYTGSYDTKGYGRNEQIWSTDEDFKLQHWKNMAKSAGKWSTDIHDTYTENQSYHQNYGVDKYTRHKSVWSDEWLEDAMSRGFTLDKAALTRETTTAAPVLQMKDTYGMDGEFTGRVAQTRAIYDDYGAIVGQQDVYKTPEDTTGSGGFQQVEYLKPVAATELTILAEELRRNEWQMKQDEAERQAVYDEQQERLQGTSMTSGLGIANIGSSIETMGDATADMEGKGGGSGVRLLG